MTAFSGLTTFADMVSEAIKTTDCCSYIRSSRYLFTSFAIPTITTNEVLTYSNLLSLGTCFAATIPPSLLSTLNSTEFLNYYPTNAGKQFQPDATEITTVKSKITEAGSSYDQEEYVFQTLNDLAVFYPSYSSLNSVCSF